MTEGRDKWWDEEIAKVPVYCPVEAMSSEDPLFILYVSLLLARVADCRPPDRRASQKESFTPPLATCLELCSR